MKFREYETLTEANDAIQFWNDMRRAGHLVPEAAKYVATLDWINDEAGPYVMHLDEVQNGHSQHGVEGHVCRYLHADGTI